MNWPIVKLGDLFKVTSGGTPSRSIPEYYENGDIPWIKTGDLHNRYVEQASEYITSAGLNSSSTRLYPVGTVLVAMYGATIGACSTLKIPACTNQACAAFTPNEKVDTDYLYYFLKHSKPVFVNAGSGGAQPNISAGYLKNYEIPLPPLAEQKRIAAILDKADAIRRKRQQAIQLADDFLKAVFLDMFGDPVANPKGCEIKKIEDVSFRVTKGESPKWQGFDYGDDGVRFITSENVLWGKLDNRVKFIPHEFHEKLKRSQVTDKDLLINLVGASVGRACLATIGKSYANVNQAVSVTTLNSSRILPEIALIQILLPSLQRTLIGNAVDAARANVSLKNIRELELIIPPFPLQQKFMEIVSRFSLHQKKITSSVEDYLFSSLSQKAFSGQL